MSLGGFQSGSNRRQALPTVIFIVAFGTASLQLLFAQTAAEPSATTLPAGSVLFLRLETPVSTKASHLRDAVRAQVVREVPDRPGGKQVLIPCRAVVRGAIEKIIPSSSPTDRARLRLRFNHLELPGQPPVVLEGHVVDVENSRETVLADGTIQGVLASELPLTLLENALDKLKKTQPDLGDRAQKTSEQNLGKSDTSIEYPAGTDLTLVLDKPLALAQSFPSAVSEELSPQVSAPVARLLEEAPQRASSKDGKPGDPLNLVVIGSAEEIRRAFQEAGWAEAEKLTGKSLFETVRAVIANKGYGTAPVSQLYLFGRPEDLAFQKMLNTFAKRHHLRLWRSPATAAAREIWLGAATHDIGWDIRAEVVSHAIEPEIDKEREKVGADLAATGRVATLRLVSRPNPLSEGLTATGGAWKTDGRLLVIELKGP
jgi:hypothetical protein